MIKGGRIIFNPLNRQGNLDYFIRGVIFMKKMTMFMVVMVMMFAAMFAGCGKKVDNGVDDYGTQAQAVRAYMTENWGDKKDCFVAAEKVGASTWEVKYRFRIDGLKNDRWFNNWRLIEVVDGEVLLINAYAD